MSQTLYQVYRKQVFELAATMVVKHSDVADAINTSLTELGISVRTEPDQSLDNTTEMQAYGINIADPAQVAYWQELFYKRTWKYYRNLFGEYHEVDKARLFNAQYRTLMSTYGDPAVGSFENPAHYETLSGTQVLDIHTLSQHLVIYIPTEVRVLAGHPAPPVPVNDTIVVNLPVAFDKAFVSDANVNWEYRYGTLFHEELIKRYPEYEMLINGILNPVDPIVAIDAVDGDILYIGDYFRRKHSNGTRVVFTRLSQSLRIYSNLIEENEIDLIQELQTWVKGFLYRWNVRDYAKFDDLYIGAMLGVLYLQIPNAIMNIRLSFCKTPRAHSYHIRQYLQSHGELAQYVPALRKRQSLYLYRNVKWIQANSGKQETFDDLVTNIMTGSGLSLSAYVAKHKYDGLKTSVIDLDDAATGLEPDVTMQRIALNQRQLGSGSEYRTVLEIVTKEAPLSKDGGLYIPETAAEITEQIATGNYSKLNTKVLESVAVDTRERMPFKFSDILFNHWIYLARVENGAGRPVYDGSVFFSIPGNSTRIRLSPRDAVILFFYAYNKGYCNIELTSIPMFSARMIPRQRHPAIAGLPPMFTRLVQFNPYVDRSLFTNAALSEIVAPSIAEPSSVNSIGLYNHADRVHRQLMDRYYRYVALEHKDARAHGEYAAMLMYWHEVPCDYTEGVTVPYSQWLDDRGLVLTGMSPSDYRLMADEILLNATGAAAIGNQSLRDLQRAAVAVMRQFTSYTVQFIQTLTDDNADITDWKTLRVGDTAMSMADTQHVDIENITAIDQRGSMQTYGADDHGVTQRIAVVADAFEPIINAIQNNPSWSGARKYREGIKAYCQYYTEAAIYGYYMGLYPDAYMQTRDSVDISLKGTMSAQISYRLQVPMGGLRVVDLTSSDEALESVLPQYILDGFNLPPP